MDQRNDNDPEVWVSVEEKELEALREAASQFIPYKLEAERLALALYRVDPGNRLLRSDIWQEFIAEHEARVAQDVGFEPGGNADVERAVAGLPPIPQDARLDEGSLE